MCAQQERCICVRVCLCKRASRRCICVSACVQEKRSNCVHLHAEVYLCACVCRRRGVFACALGCMCTFMQKRSRSVHVCVCAGEELFACTCECSRRCVCACTRQPRRIRAGGERAAAPAPQRCEARLLASVWAAPAAQGRAGRPGLASAGASPQGSELGSLRRGLRRPRFPPPSPGACGGAAPGRAPAAARGLGGGAKGTPCYAPLTRSAPSARGPLQGPRSGLRGPGSL